jgi:Trypsin-like peptidase domain
MLAYERIVRIEALKPNTKHSIGTGTLIGERLVLTAAHVISDRDAGEPYTEIKVAVYGNATPFAAREVWVGNKEMDAALITVDDPNWAWPVKHPNHPLRLGRLTGRAAGVKFESMGFPRVRKDNTRDTEHLKGTLNPGTGIVVGRYGLDITSSVPSRPCDQDDPSPWAGLSGAALICSQEKHQLLSGIVLRDMKDMEGRLYAIPIHFLATDILFRQHLTDAGYSLVVESVELAPMLVADTPPSPDSPATLLRADRGVVPFLPRTEYDSLRKWCSGEDEVSVRLLTGAGGLGKTRLARRLAEEMTESGWVAGFLERDLPSHEIELGPLSEAETPVLLVVDYAETRRSQVERLLGAVRGASDFGPFRLLLLTRSAGDWWAKLDPGYPDWRETAAVIGLTLIDAKSQNRGEAWREALAAFAARLHKLHPAVGWEGLAAAIAEPPDLLRGGYGSPLTLQTAALTALLQAGPHLITGLAGFSPEDVLLEHERVYWQRTAAVRLPRPYDDSELGVAVVAATLLGAASEQEAVATLKRMRQFGDDKHSERMALARWIAELYPAPSGQCWGTLQPDPVAEHHINAVLRGDPGLLEALFIGAAFDQHVRGLNRLVLAQPTSKASRAAFRRLLIDCRAELEAAGRGCAFLRGGSFPGVSVMP